MPTVEHKDITARSRIEAIIETLEAFGGSPDMCVDPRADLIACLKSAAFYMILETRTAFSEAAINDLAGAAFEAMAERMKGHR